jgi:hypothetical protein
LELSKSYRASSAARGSQGWRCGLAFALCVDGVAIAQSRVPIVNAAVQRAQPLLLKALHVKESF